MNSKTPHAFTPNPMRGNRVNWSECAECRMPPEHRVHDITGLRAEGPPMTPEEWEPFANALGIEP